MFKNTLVDEIFKTAISSHHLRHTVKQITKAVDIQSSPILPIACTRVESNFVYFINRKTNQRVFKNVVIISLLALATLFISCLALEILCKTEFDCS